jgi:hypothetical protein
MIVVMTIVKPFTPIVIRAADATDADALVRLAALDSAAPLSGAVLVAEAGDRLRAALSLADGRAIADPFAPSAADVALLRARAGLGAGRSSRTHRRGEHGARRRALPRLARA